MEEAVSENAPSVAADNEEGGDILVSRVFEGISPVKFSNDDDNQQQQ